MPTLLSAIGLVWLLMLPAHAAPLTLEWDAVADPRVLGYRLVYWHTPDRSNLTSVPVGLQTSHTLASLTPGSYTFVVYAHGDGGLRSAFSNEVQHTEPDVTKPRVSITAPRQRSGVVRQRRVTITARATDDVKVTRVEVRVNGVRRCTDTTAPYTCAWTVPNVAGVYRLQATAWDAAGHRTRSAVIQVTAR